MPIDPGPCWPECQELLTRQLVAEIHRIESILVEREKATELLAKSEVNRATMMILDKMEERLRSIEMNRGAVDAKLYMIILGLPIIVSAAVAVFMSHVVPR